MESAIRDSLVEHLKTNNLLAEEQHGFVSGRSCVTQLLECLESWTRILDNYGCIDVIYFDFQKAFDTVPHHRLLMKLKAYGIQDQLLKWIESFLSNRKQRVSVNGSKSSWEDVVSGVPQGSVLGPVLFVIYINDLPRNVLSTIKLFADDTKLFRQVSTPQDCQLLQNDITTLEEWSKNWLLCFHPNKCKVLRIGKGHPEFQYQMTSPEGQLITLQETTVEKDLGVNIDNKLSFRKHIDTTVKKANQITGLIRRTFTFLDRETFPLLFRSLVRPHLEYGNSVWTPKLIKDQILVENVQRRATKLVPGLYDLPYEERLRCLKLPTLAHRRARGDMIETFKFIHNKYNVNTSWIPVQPNKITRGHSLPIAKQHCKLNIRRHAFSQRIVDNWNSLPEDVACAPTLNCFKSRLDKHWSQYKYQI